MALTLDLHRRDRKQLFLEQLVIPELLAVRVLLRRQP
jgi:hypothetical protein